MISQSELENQICSLKEAMKSRDLQYMELKVRWAESSHFFQLIRDINSFSNSTQ